MPFCNVLKSVCHNCRAQTLGKHDFLLPKQTFVLPRRHARCSEPGDKCLRRLNKKRLNHFLRAAICTQIPTLSICCNYLSVLNQHLGIVFFCVQSCQKGVTGQLATVSRVTGLLVICRTVLRIGYSRFVVAINTLYPIF